MRFSELPEDLPHVEETLGPPPSWLQMPSTMATPANYMYQYYSGLGSREEEGGEFEVDPVEQLQEMKFKQEMSKQIPTEAARYTEVNPLSPMFRAQKAKFGFGVAILEKKSYIGIAIGVTVLFLIWLIFLKKKAEK